MATLSQYSQRKAATGHLFPRFYTGTMASALRGSFRGDEVWTHPSDDLWNNRCSSISVDPRPWNQRDDVVPIAGDLARHYRVYAPDTIGDLGKSASTKLRYDSDDHSRWLNEVFEQLGLASARVAGISEGGAVALRFALTFPKRVDRLALLAPASLHRIRAGMMVRGTLAMFFPMRP